MKTIKVRPRSHGRYVGYLSNGIKIKEANKIVGDVLGIGPWTLEKWFVEPNPKRRFHKPELEKALEMCVKRNMILIIPKVQHLVHNMVFVDLCYKAEIQVEQMNHAKKKLEILGCDLMGVEPLQMGLLYSLAQAKSEKTSKSVKEKMKELKEQGVKLGAPDLSIARAHSAAALRSRAKERRAEILPIIKEIKKDGNRTLQEIARQLNKRGVPTARGGKWYATSVRNIIKG